MPFVSAGSSLVPCGPVSRVPPLRKALGQHHLRHPGSAIPAIDFLDVAGRSVVEIGPGGGVLTRLLLERGASRVIACELDPLWTLELRRRIADPRLAPVTADGCDLRYEKVLASTRIAGNLPYNAATRIILAVLERAALGVRSAFLVQREVADRLTASPGESGYGGLSVLVAARASARRLAIVRPGSFVPAPAVTSAFVGLERCASPLDEAEWSRFANFVRAAFRQRRKTLVNNLRPSVGRPAVEAALSALDLPSSARAESLGLSEFVALFREL